MTNPKEVDWSLFDSQEKEISTINNELYDLRKQKYPEYRDSYYRHYNEFGMRGMIGDLYRKFDRLKIMSESYVDSTIRNKEKEITDQFYDIISYCQLQLYWLRREKWASEVKNIYTHDWSKTDSGSSSFISAGDRESAKRDLEKLLTFTPVKIPTITITLSGTDLQEIDVKKLCELITKRIEENFGR